MTMVVPPAEKPKIPKNSIQLWILAVILIAMAPALHTIVTWDLDGRLTPQAFAIRHYSYMIVLIEMLIISLAVKDKMSIQMALSDLPKSTLTLVGLWLALALAGLFWHANGMVNATFNLVRYITHGLFFLALVHLLRNSDEFEMRRWLVTLSVGTIVYVMMLVIFYMVVSDAENFPWVLRMPSATNIRQISNNVGILAIAPVVLLIAKGRPFSWPNSLAVMLIFAFISWTGSRATLLGMVIGIGLGLLIVKRVASVQNMLATAGSALVGLVISFFAPIPNPAFGLFRLIKSSSEQVDPSSGRWELWDRTWQQILQSPLIGHGAGRFAGQMNLLYGTGWNHPHNFILQFIYDWGFIGGSIALSLVAILGLKIFWARDAEPIAHFAAVAAFTAICSTALIDGPLFHPLPIVAALTLIAPVFVKASST